MKNQMSLAVIDEQLCIGCTKCISACPVDAIIGAEKQMHTVLTQECTGCKLCIAPCPVDCIHMVAVPLAIAEQRQARAKITRKRVWARKLRTEENQPKMQMQPLIARKVEIAEILKRKLLNGPIDPL